jgi:hypothetical protein
MDVARSSDPPLRQVQIEGALLGAALPAVVAAAGSALGAVWSIGVLDLSLLAVAVGALIGAQAAPKARSAAHPVALALGAALKASLTGIAAVLLAALASTFLAGGSGGTAASGASGFGFEAAAGMVIFVAYGLLLSLPFTIPIALVGVAAIRLGRSRAMVPRLIAAGALTAAAGFALAGSAAPSGPPLLGAGVRVTWTIANHSSSPLNLQIADPGGDGSLGWSEQWIAACFVTTGVDIESDDWFISITKPAPDGAGGIDEPLPSPIVSAVDLPGREPVVWIDVAADGTLTVMRGRPPPAGEDLTTDLCREAGE